MTDFQTPAECGKFLTGKYLTRFWSRVAIGRKEDCWPWDRPTHYFGYGRLWIGNGCDSTHRIAYKDCKGPIPDGLVVRHKCDNPSCCNPHHLEVGTQKQNLEDATQRGRLVRGKFYRDKWMKMQAESKARGVAAALAAGLPPMTDQNDLKTEVERLKRELEAVRKSIPDNCIHVQLDPDGRRIVGIRCNDPEKVEALRLEGHKILRGE